MKDYYATLAGTGSVQESIQESIQEVIVPQKRELEPSSSDEEDFEEI